MLILLVLCAQLREAHTHMLTARLMQLEAQKSQMQTKRIERAEEAEQVNNVHVHLPFLE